MMFDNFVSRLLMNWNPRYLCFSRVFNKMLVPKQTKNILSGSFFILFSLFRINLLGNLSWKCSRFRNSQTFLEDSIWFDQLGEEMFWDWFQRFPGNVAGCGPKPSQLLSGSVEIILVVWKSVTAVLESIFEMLWFFWILLYINICEICGYNGFDNILLWNIYIFCRHNETGALRHHTAV